MGIKLLPLRRGEVPDTRRLYCKCNEMFVKQSPNYGQFQKWQISKGQISLIH